jgi:crotonobetainyl-CoA:carnitine CoA-transferase CaiB-like acyl-CoA transferase
MAMTPGRIAPSCLCGEHPEAILAELGFSPEQIEELERRGIVFSTS